ncbi:F-box only protein 41 [Cololabis saira]|uniref:F-box only protein 41 n=1 Tax=Cololabis saira TaxID=129043 RepID=UPI002AD2E0F4|nr:F-box only protein 41 [Cololabis saira]
MTPSRGPGAPGGPGGPAEPDRDQGNLPEPFTSRAMQQKLGSRSSFLPERNGQACGAVSPPGGPSCPLPFRCPRCGDQERFLSIASLRAHLERRHSYRPPDASPASFSITGKLPDPLTAATIPWHDDASLPTRRGPRGAARPPHIRSLSDCRDGGGFPPAYGSAHSSAHGSARRRTQSVGVGTQAEDDEEDEDEDEEEEMEEEEGRVATLEEEDDGGEEGTRTPPRKSDAGHAFINHFHFPFNSPVPLGRPPDQNRDQNPDLELVEQSAETAAASVRRRLASILRAADGTMQRRLARVSTELAQTDTELLCERAHSQHLAQARQEVAERERSLSRQVDVAVMVIAALREQLNASENELERREREVLTIQRFLEAAARQETSGKVRIQQFIENLLTRIALAERLVEYYQDAGTPPRCTHHQQQNSGAHRITKSRSAAGQLFSSGLPDTRTQSFSQFGAGPAFSRAGGSRDREREHRERLAQSSRLFCRPEHRDDIWNHQRRRSTGYEA